MGRIAIINKPEISAIYFALLQCGYDFYAIEKDASLIESIEGFRNAASGFDDSFFSKVRQNTCEVYPYWPRAAALETATYYLHKDSLGFSDYDAYKKSIMNATNVSDVERDEDFWEWVIDFPVALKRVLESSDFISYLDWENAWVSQQNHLWKSDLQHIQRVLNTCMKNYSSPIQTVSIVLNPIKCTYSSDHFINNDELNFTSGVFRMESVLHEFLHHVVHPFVSKHKQAVMKCQMPYPDIDGSYYLGGDENGKLNAFEEYVVRMLTSEDSALSFPADLDWYVNGILSDLGHFFAEASCSNDKVRRRN